MQVAVFVLPIKCRHAQTNIVTLVQSHSSPHLVDLVDAKPRRDLAHSLGVAGFCSRRLVNSLIFRVL